jgi:hypothetical protein
MRHPDLPDSPPVEVVDSAVPQHRSGGWYEVDPPLLKPEPKSQAAADMSQVRLRHPEVDDEITVAASAAPFHAAAGWSVVETPAKTEQADGTEPDGEKTKGERPRASAAKKKEQH